ncbi:hypothetical protein FIE12Z_2452 [Fusarium flagelliforme]|uniref:Uncharacterized protein n=1 Tax=Fusarium flagelliforme TaxID=2675880 RepID=A0A395MZF3_9HYPO|nr:hypothetical protein FIE12Z_2452 [Fusarium flagelliforme]
MNKTTAKLVGYLITALRAIWAFPGVAYRRIVNRCETLLRAVGLGLTTITKGPEQPKKLFTISRRVALARCGVHILPSFVSLILITINLLGYFIGGELQGSQNRDSIKLGTLQIVAKIQELLVVASLSTVIFHVLRSELVFGPGLPLGLLGAGFKFTSLSFFWSSEFWGSVAYKGADHLRKASIFGLLILSGLLAVLAGPTTAVLMIPRELEWKAGGVNFYLNGTKEEMWPNYLGVPTVNCSGSNWLNNSRCLANGYQSIHETFSNRRGSSQNGLISLQIADSDLYKTVHARARESETYIVETWAYTAHVPSAMMHAASVSLWVAALNYLVSIAKPTMHPNPKLLRYASSRTASVRTELPAARVLCDITIPVDRNTTYVEARFPMLPEHGLQARDNRLNYADIWFQLQDVTSIVMAMMNTPASTRILVEPVDLQPIPDQASSVGVLLLSPDSENMGRWILQGCSIDGRWAKGKTKITENPLSVKYDFSSDQPRSTVDSKVDVEAYGWARFKPPNDGTWRRINITAGWLSALNVELPGTGQANGTRNQRTIESILEVASDRPLGDMDSNLMREFALAVIVADGLSRSSSWLTTNYGSTFEPLVSEPWNKSSATTLVRLGGPKNTPKSGTSTNNAKLHMQMELHGYAMSAESWFDFLCIVVLLTHTMIALGHSVWVVWHRRTSDAWENITEVLTLGLNSDRPGQTGEPGLENTSAGIRTWVPTGQIGWIEAIDGNTSTSTALDRPEELQLRFGRGRHMKGGQKDDQFQAEENTNYGTI